MHSKTINELPIEKDVKSEGREWLFWCRLCAKEDKDGNINVFLNDDHSSSTATTSIMTWIGNCANNGLNLSASIGKFFWVNITRDEELPKMLCTECFSLVTALVNFSERVSKVQQMYAVLLNTKDLKSSDLATTRKKYGFNDKDREQVMTQVRLPEFRYFEPKPQLTDCPEDEQIQDNADDCNSLERAGQSLAIKKEFCVVYNEELIQNNGLYVENESLSNDQMQEILIPNEVNIDERSNDADDVLSVEKCNKKEKDNEILDRKIRRRLVRKIKKSANNHLVHDDSNHDENDSNRIGNFLCTKCPRKFKREQNLTNHLDRCHGMNKTNYPCADCQRVFNRRSNLERHSKVHLPLASRKVLPCPHCSKKFMANTLQSHIKYMHMQELRTNRQLICEECGISVRTNASLREHLLTHTDYAPFECEVCKKGFKSQSRLKLHLEIHDPNKHVCAECGLQLNSRVTLNRHLLVHSDEMQHKCDYCGRAFKRAKALKNHLILHTGLKPYSCDFCDRTFANGANCRTHKKKSHPEELAALEAAGGGKTYTKNIPKLEALKAVTKTAENLAPVVSKQSGRFAFGKKPKPPDKSKGVKSSESKNNKITSNESTSNECKTIIGTINDEAVDKQHVTEGNDIQHGQRECVYISNDSRVQFQLQPPQQHLLLQQQPQPFVTQQTAIRLLAAPQPNGIIIKAPLITNEPSNTSLFYVTLRPNIQQPQLYTTQYL